MQVREIETLLGCQTIFVFIIEGGASLISVCRCSQEQRVMSTMLELVFRAKPTSGTDSKKEAPSQPRQMPGMAL